MSVRFFAKAASAFATTVALVLGSVLGIATPAAAQVQTAVEYGLRLDFGSYYYYDSFFVTAFPEEIAALDAGAFGRIWERTGLTFDVWTGPESGAVPTCRFFQPFFTDHVYTPYAAECATVQAHADWHYQYEGIAFYLKLPDENGQCPAGTTNLYRVYSEGGARPHHQLIANYYALLDSSGTLEGNGPTFAFACVPCTTPQEAAQVGGTCFR
jgi:Repeat of unknown function (DUF5648)